jgi:predicted nucleic acid-binding protein
MNGAKAFFDTNVLLYMYGGDVGKQARAKELFRQYAQAGRMLLSTQVVQEFYAAGSRKLGMPRPELRDATAALLDSPLIIVGPLQITSAIQNEERYRISFWDALILAAAESGGAAILYTEDLNDGQQYGTVLVRNPFRSPDRSLSTN